MHRLLANIVPLTAMQQTLYAMLLGFCLACCPVAAYAGTQPTVKAESLELQIHRQVNLLRQQQGLAPLTLDAQLAAIARNHSIDMAEHHFFSHYNLQQEDPSDRGKRQGWEQKKQIGKDTWAYGLAENIFLDHLYDKVITTRQQGRVVKRSYAWKSEQDIVATAVQGWLQSPTHRKNLLSPQYDRQGIGVAISGINVFITEVMF